MTRPLPDRSPPIEALVTSALAGVAGVAASFAVAGFAPAFLVAPIEGLLSRTMPGAVVTFAISTLGSLGQKLNLAVATVLAVALLAAVALVAIAVARRLGSPLAAAPLAAVLAFGVSVAVTGALVSSLAAGLATGGAVAVPALVGALPRAEPTPSPTRRRLLGSSLVVLGGSALGFVVGRARTPSATGELSSVDTGDGAVDALLAEAGEKSLDVAGIEPLVSEDFYQVDINAVDPTIDMSEWSLSVTGAVESPVTLGYDDLRGQTPEHRFSTLRCVGEQLNGKKMDTALWTGVPVMDLLERAGPESGCECVMLRAEDGYYEEFPLAALEDGFLAYGMNGEVLPRGHGFPVRALVPGHWGEINVKWVTEIEVLEREADGYWEERGWHGTGPVKTVAKLHAVNHLDGRVQVGGHAHAGTRGIEAVEVSTDGGDTWADATLSAPLPGADVWRQWSYEYEPPGGSHEVVVRAVDGTGAVQPREETGPFPDGPAGWVSRRVG